jgi:subtilisin family serine protease
MSSGIRPGARRRAQSLIGAVLLAALLLTSGIVQAIPAALADSVGEIVVMPVSGKTIADVNAKFGTTTQLQLTNTPQAMVRTNAVNATLSAMQANVAGVPSERVVDWFEQNVSADDPRAQDGDSGSDPYCPPPPPDAPTQTSAQDGDSGSDGRHCTRTLSLLAPTLMPRQYSLNGQYAVDQIKLDEAQDVKQSLLQKVNGSGQKVAILDTQVDILHPNFLLHTTLGLDLVTSSLLTIVPTQGHARGHGTFVAGIVRQAAPGAIIMPVRVLNEDGRGSTAQVAEGIRWAVAHGADVINMSLHTPTDTRVLREAVAHAIERGVVVVAAYGNEGKNMPAAYPADYPNVISVMATDQNDKRASFSNYGRPGLVAAPGVNIISTYVTLRYGIGSGTSYAAPWVAGVAALVKDKDSSLRPDQVLKRIQSSADDVSAANGGNRTMRVNAYRAVTSQVR